MLAQTLLRAAILEMGKSEITLQPDALDAMQHYSWPGNIRELKNVIERAVLLSGARELSRRDLLFDTESESDHSWQLEGELTLEQLQRKYIEWMLQQCGGKVVVAARRLDIPKSTLYQKLKEYQIEVPRAATAAEEE
jgi:DNA-binding NtrC family response regulator